MEKQKGKVELIEGIEPFNDVFYKGCLYNAQFPVLKYYNKNIVSFLINDVIVYTYDEKDKVIGIDYLPCGSIEKVLAKEGVEIEEKKVCEDVKKEVVEGVARGNPVALQIDSYYSPLRKDTYNKIHWRHVMLIYGFDLEEGCFHIIEHSHRNNLTYTKKVMGIGDVEKAYWGGIDYFGTSRGSYHEIINVRESKSNEMPKTLLEENQKEALIQNIRNNKEQLYIGLERLEAFMVEYLKVMENENAFEAKAIRYIEAINPLISAKEVEQYRVRCVFGETSSYYSNIENITNLWKKIRMYFAKYMFSRVFQEKELRICYKYMQQIIEFEKAYIELYS